MSSKTLAVTAVIAAAVAVAGVGGYTVANAHSTRPAAAITVPAPARHHAAQPSAKPPAARPDPTKTVYVPQPAQAAPPAPAQAPAPAALAPAAAPQLSNGVAVVLQFYQDLNNHDYQDAWQLGGDNLNGGTGYDAWVAGYDTTASISVTSYGEWNDGTVWTHISAVQTDGSVRTYDGTYTVANGVIVSANMTQTS